MIALPTRVPAISAHCWRAGVAPTSWPVLRSCRLSLEIVALASTAEVMKRASGTAMAVAPAGIASSASEERLTARMAMPEIGLEDEPTMPAM